MKKEIKDKWVEALRSGKYQQGKSCLSDSGNFCCLGVLCELASKEIELNVVKPDNPFRVNDTATSYNGEHYFLPNDVMEWAGIKTTDAAINIPDREIGYSLAIMNDSGRSFYEIAQAIDEHWEEL